MIQTLLVIQVKKWTQWHTGDLNFLQVFKIKAFKARRQKLPENTYRISRSIKVYDPFTCYILVSLTEVILTHRII